MKKTQRYILICSVLLLFASCRKFVETDVPATSLAERAVYGKEKNATAAVLDAYYDLLAVSADFYNATANAMTAMNADEWQLYGTSVALVEAYQNALQADNTFTTLVWNRAYAGIYKTNSALEGIAAYGASLPETVRNQLLGEARFQRASLYFYLVNLYGAVPLVLTTNYKENQLAGRTPVAQVYAQIVADLTEAKQMLQTAYLNGNNLPATNRIRANKAAATAMLARVYLYMENWTEAEKVATEVIGNTADYTLETNLDNVFLISNREAVLQMSHPTGWFSPPSAYAFSVNAIPTVGTTQSNYGAFSQNQMAAFEPGDARRTNWVGTFTAAGTDYHFSEKYIVTTGAHTQYYVMIRLAELYLIRAEARLQQPGKEAAGIGDLNVLRMRSREAATSEVPDPLPPLPDDMTKANALLALEKERRAELFAEGHRWYDIKRWKGFNNPAISRADEIMPAITAAKGSVWDARWKLWPLPLVDVRANVNLSQNDGYGQ